MTYCWVASYPNHIKCQGESCARPDLRFKIYLSSKALNNTLRDVKPESMARRPNFAAF